MASDNYKKLRELFQSKTKDDRIAFIQGLDKKQQLFFFNNPDMFLFDKQIIPDTNDWLFYLLRCGRGFGKSYAGSAWIAKKIRSGSKMIGLCGPTYDDVSKVMVPAILSWFQASELCQTPYNHQTHTVNFINGAKIYCYTSEKPIKGPNLEYLWCDEIAQWCSGIPEKIQSNFEDIVRTVRVGAHPQTIITSTPMSHPFFWDFQKEIDNKNPNYKMTTGSMFDNPFLPKSFVNAQLAKYGKSAKGRQELYGDLITENPEALFQMPWINNNRITSNTNANRDNKIDLLYFWDKITNNELTIKRIVISIDPSGSSKKSSDETGIIVAAQDMKNEVYILQDASDTYTPDQWAKKVRDLFYHYSKHFNTLIVVETNFGGDMVISNICAADHTLKQFIKDIKASKSKLIRAEPVAGKYERGKIHHVGYFELLERQMCNYVGTKDNAIGGKSPDRMDALCHAVNELVIIHQYSNRSLSEIEAY